MKKATRILMIIATLIIAVSVFVACGHTPSDDGNPDQTTYTVTFASNGGSSVSPVTGTVATEPIPTRNNYDFAGWFDNQGLTGNRVTFPFTPSKDVTLYAKWNERQTVLPEDPTGFTVTFETNGGSAIAGAKVTKIEQEPVTTRDGYDFAGWFDNAGLTGERITFPYTVTKNMTLYAKWTAKVSAQWVQTTLADFEKNVNSYDETELLYKGSDSKIILPRDIADLGDAVVFEIENEAVKAVMIPTTIQTLYAGNLTAAYAPYIEEIAVENGHTTFKTDDGVLLSSDGKTIVAYPGGKTAKNYTVPAGVETIGAYCFYGNMAIENLVVSEGVKELAECSCWYMRNLKTIDLPSTLQVLGNCCLGGNQLAEIEIPTGITSMSSNTFYGGCPNLTKVVGPFQMSNSALKKLTNLQHIEFNGGTTMTGGLCKDITTLKTAVFSAPIENLGSAYGSGIFQGCTNLESVTLLSGLKLIGNSAFKDCTSLASIEIPSTVTEISNNAFNGCTALKSVILPEGFTKYGSTVFDNSGVEELYIPTSITSVGSLSGATKLKTVSCPASKISSLKSTTILNLTILDGEVPKLSSGAFETLNTLTIGKDVTSIDALAFQYCYGMVQITNLSGVSWTPKMNDPMTVDNTPADSPAEYRTSTNTAFKGTITTDKNGFVKYTCENEVRLLHADRDVKTLTKSDLAGYTSIGAYAFYYCKELTSVAIPSNIKKIGHYAFRWCDGISSLTFEEGLEYIGSNAFTPTKLVTTITIPQSVTYVGNQAFSRSSGDAPLTINVKGHSSKPSTWHNSWLNDQASLVTINWNA